MPSQHIRAIQKALQHSTSEETRSAFSTYASPLSPTHYTLEAIPGRIADEKSRWRRRKPCLAPTALGVHRYHQVSSCNEGQLMSLPWASEGLYRAASRERVAIKSCTESSIYTPIDAAPETVFDPFTRIESNAAVSGSLKKHRVEQNKVTGGARSSSEGRLYIHSNNSRSDRQAAITRTSSKPCVAAVWFQRVIVQSRSPEIGDIDGVFRDCFRPFANSHTHCCNGDSEAQLQTKNRQ